MAQISNWPRRTTAIKKNGIGAVKAFGVPDQTIIKKKGGYHNKFLGTMALALTNETWLAFTFTVQIEIESIVIEWVCTYYVDI